MARVLEHGVQRFARAAGGAWTRVLATGASYVVLPIRLGFGLIFFAHGAQKLFGLFGGAGLPGTAEAFAAMGFTPGLLMAGLAGLIETLGGLLLVFGLLTRPAAVVIALEMLVAAITVHWRSGFFLNWSLTPGVGHGIEYNLALVVGLIGVVIYGAGAISIDRQLGHARRHFTGKPPATPPAP